MVDIEKDAKDLLEKAKKERAEMTKKAEPKGAAPAPSAENKKTEGETEGEKKAKLEADAKAKEAADAKAKADEAKKDEDILKAKDEDLDELQRKRKSELVTAKEKSNVQKRIDELTAKSKAAEEKLKAMEADNQATKAEKDAVKAELDAIKKKLSMTPQDEVKEKVKGELSKRIQSYAEEDKKLPREDRREMTKEEFDEWLSEDTDAAQEWRERRTYRRLEDEKSIKTDIELTARAEHILNKRAESGKRVQIKHPELGEAAVEAARLIKEGKTKEEAVKILSEKFPKYKVVMDIYRESPEKYELDENGPETLAAEMEKRMGKTPDKTGEKPEEVEALRKKLAEAEAERDALKGLDTDTGSTRHAEPKTPLSEDDKELDKLAKDVGLDPVKVRERAKLRAHAR